jgi:hypothetical protein
MILPSNAELELERDPLAATSSSALSLQTLHALRSEAHAPDTLQANSSRTTPHFHEQVAIGSDVFPLTGEARVPNDFV